MRICSTNIEDAVLREAGLQPVKEPKDADAALIRVDAPYEHRDTYMLENAFRAGSLDFDEAFIFSVRSLSESVPVILIVHLDRPAVLTALEPHVSALVGVYGTSDEALMKALTNEIPPQGRLPFTIPRSSESIRDSAPDAGGDFHSLYPLGHGLRLESSAYWDAEVRHQA